MFKALPWAVMSLLVSMLVIGCNPSRLKAERVIAEGVGVLNAGEVSNAIAQFERATGIDPTSAKAWYYLGYTRARKVNNFQGAVDALREATRLEPGNAEYAYQFAYALENAGLTDEALEVYEVAGALDPSIEGLLYRLGYLYERKGEFRSAIDAYQRAIHGAPHFVNSWIALGNLYAEFGAPDAGLLVFENGIENNPESSELQASLGIALFELGRNAESITALERSLELGDERASTSMTLSMAYLVRAESTDSASDRNVAVAHMERAARACSPATEGTRCAVIAAKLASMERY